MQDYAHYGVGIDVGTTSVKCVIGYQNDSSQVPNIVGVGVAPNNGMRRGVVVNIVNTAQAIDHALEEAERMSGHQVHSAVISINGAHIAAMTSRGVVAVGAQNHEISPDDLARAEEAATVVQLPANRQILQVTPRGYQLDGQENIKDPLGMSGVRLELDAHVITALSPHIKNLLKAIEMTETRPQKVVVSGLAAARAALTTQQMENGVVLIDFGSSTTNVVVYEEGDLQHAAVIPLGSINITNDLAIGLRTDLEVAQKIALQHASATKQTGKDKQKTIEIQHNREKLTFDAKDIDIIVEARLDEIFELVDKELKQIDRSGKLPGGAVLCGGGSNLKNIRDYAKHQLRLPVCIASLSGYSGINDKTSKPEFAAALGLMMTDFDQNTYAKSQNSHHRAFSGGGGIVGGVVKQTLDIFKKLKP